MLMLTTVALVSLARAVYSRASLLLLDDVLSAGQSQSSQYYMLISKTLDEQWMPILPTICIMSV